MTSLNSIKESKIINLLKNTVCFVVIVEYVADNVFFLFVRNKPLFRSVKRFFKAVST